jgi:hypothetical protein
LITLARARTARRVGSHGDPEWRRGEELVGEVDAVLKGGDGGAGELHEITAKLLEVMVWLEKGWGELTMAWWSTADGECGYGPVEKKSRKRIAVVRADISSRRELLVMLSTGGASWRPGRARAETGRCGARGRRPEEKS